MEEKIKIVLRSDEVDEIISQVPGRLLRYGIAIILGVLLVIISISWLVKYPDLLTAEVVITTTPSPVNIVSRIGGTLRLLKMENEFCRQDELLGYIQNNARVEDVLAVEKSLRDESFVNFGSLSPMLGDIQSYLSVFLSAQADLRFFSENDRIGKQIDQLKKQLEVHLRLEKVIASQRKLASEELKLANEKFQIDSLLFVNSVYAAIDFNRNKKEWLHYQQEARSSEASLMNNQLQMNQIEKQIVDLSNQRIELRKELEMSVVHTRSELATQIIKWKENYLFVASQSGKVAHFGFLEDGMHVEGGKLLLSILPGEGNKIARAMLPMSRSGKVKIGQEVNIQLLNYPFVEYGILRGKVKSISELPNDKAYLITIDLPNVLITSQNVQIPFKEQLPGTAQIVVEDLRLLSRFFYQLSSFFSRP